MQISRRAVVVVAVVAVVGLSVLWQGKPASADLINWWALDEPAGSTVATDSSGNSNDGTLQNFGYNADSDFVPDGGKFGGALHFDEGSGNVNNQTGFQPSSQFTYSWFFKPDVTLNPGDGRIDFIRSDARPHFSLDRDNGDGRLGMYPVIGGGTESKSSTDTWLADTWYHVAWTYDGAEFKTFVNGVEEGSVAETGDHTVQGDGRFNLGRQEFDGMIDDLAIWDEALSAADIGLIALIGVDAALTATPAVYTWDNSPSVGNWGTANWDKDIPTMTPDWPAFVPPTSLIAAVIDGAGVNVHVEGNHSARSLDILQGEITIDAGKSLTLFDGITGSKVTLQANSSLTARDGSLDSLTVAGNATINTTSGKMTVGALDVAADATFDKTGKGTIVLNNSGDSGINAAASSVFKVSGGVLRTTGTNPLGGAQNLTLAGGRIAITGELAVGVAPINPKAHWAFDENAELIAADQQGVSNGFLSGFAADDSQWVPGVLGGALHFDGVDDQVDAGYAPFLNDYTVSMWVKADSVDNASGDDSVFASGDSLYVVDAFQIDVGQASGGTYEFSGAADIAMGPVEAGWVHLAVSYDYNAGQVTTYYNGQPAGSGSDITNTRIDSYLFGVNRAKDQFFAGSIDDMRIYDRVLDPTEIRTMFGESIPVNASGIDVLVTEPSQLELNAGDVTDFGTLTLADGATLETLGSAPGVTFSATTITAGATWVGVTATIPTKYAGPDGPEGWAGIDLQGRTITFAKAGAGTMVIDSTDQLPQGASQTTYEVADGVLELATPAALDNRPVRVVGGRLDVLNDPARLGDSTVELAGGTIRFTGAGGLAPLAHYSFDNQSDIENDDSGNGNTLTNGGSVVFDPTDALGGVGGSALFAGETNGYLEVPGAVAMDSTSGAAAFWFKTAPFQEFTEAGLIFYGTEGGGDGFGTQNEIHVDFRDNERLEFFVRGAPNRREYAGEAYAHNDGNWHHVVLSWDSTDGAQMYVDGNTTPVATADASWDDFDLNQIRLGRPSSDRRFFIGQIDEVWLYPHTLDGADAANLYATNSGIDPPPLLDVRGATIEMTDDSTLEVQDAYSGAAFGNITLKRGILSIDTDSAVTFDGFSIHADAVGQSVGLNPQGTMTSEQFGRIDGNQVAATWVKAGPGTLVMDATSQELTNATIEARGGTLEMVGTAAWAGATKTRLSGGTMVIADVLGVQGTGITPNDFLARWAMDDDDGSLTAADEKGTYGGTVNGDVTFVPDGGVIGGAASFGGADTDYILVPGPGLPITQTSFTVAAWALRDGTGSDYLMGMGDNNAARQSFHWGFRDNNTFSFAFYGDDLNYDGSAVTETGTWHQWVSTFDAETRRQTLYLDGILVDDRTANGLFQGSGTNDFWIGRRWNGLHHDGMVDDALIYDRALTPQEILLMYAERLEATNVSGVEVTVTENSTLRSASMADLTMAGLVMENGVLRTEGIEGFGGVVFTGGTTIAEGATQIGFNPRVPTDLGVINGNSQIVNITKQGPEDLVLDEANTGLDLATFDVRGGRLIAVPTAGNPMGGATLQVEDGELVLSAAIGDTSPVLYDNVVTGVGTGTLTAGMGGQTTAADGPMTVQVSGVTVSDTLNLRSTDDYTLELTGDLTGPGKAIVTEGTVLASAGIDVASLSVSGGSLLTAGGGTIGQLSTTGGLLSVGGDLSVTTAILNSGILSLDGSTMTVSETMKLGTVDYAISDGHTFATAGVDVLTEADITLSGGELFIGAPPVEDSWSILMVVKDTNLSNSGGDQGVYDRLTNVLGHTVTTVDDNGSSPSQAEGHDLVIVSSTVSSGNVTTKFSDQNATFAAMGIPTINWEQACVDDFAFSDDGDSVADKDTITIVAPEHPMAAGLSGDVLVYTQLDNFSTADMDASENPAPGAVIIARPYGDTRHATLLAVDEGGELSNGNLASARRVQFFFDDSGFEFATNDAYTLFDAAVNYAGGADLANSSLDQSGSNLFVTEDTKIASAASSLLLGDLSVSEGITATFEGPSVIGLQDVAAVGNATIDLGPGGSMTIGGTLLPDIAPATLIVTASTVTFASGSTYAATIAEGGGDFLDGPITSVVINGVGTTLELQIDGKKPFTEGTYDVIFAGGEDNLTGEFEAVHGLGDYFAGVSIVDQTTLRVAVSHDLHPGDADLNLTTDVRDFNAWNTNKFTSGTTWASGDFDGNGLTDVRDFNVWNTSKFTAVGNPAPTADGQVPEPGSLILLVCAALLLGCRQRRRIA